MCTGRDPDPRSMGTLSSCCCWLDAEAGPWPPSPAANPPLLPASHPPHHSGSSSSWFGPRRAGYSLRSTPFWAGPHPGSPAGSSPPAGPARGSEVGTAFGRSLGGHAVPGSWGKPWRAPVRTSHSPGRHHPRWRRGRVSTAGLPGRTPAAGRVHQGRWQTFQSLELGQGGRKKLWGGGSWSTRVLQRPCSQLWHLSPLPLWRRRWIPGHQQLQVQRHSTRVASNTMCPHTVTVTYMCVLNFT